MSSAAKPNRPGWTYYGTNFGYSCFARMPHGGASGGVAFTYYANVGQMIGGDPSAARIWSIFKDMDGVNLYTDSGSAIAWHVTGQGIEASTGGRAHVTYVKARFDAAANQTVTVTIMENGAADANTGSLALGSASSGVVFPMVRMNRSIISQHVQIKLSGSSSVAMRLRALSAGLTER
jgi:hypothetical protein